MRWSKRNPSIATTLWSKNRCSNIESLKEIVGRFPFCLLAIPQLLLLVITVRNILRWKEDLFWAGNPTFCRCGCFQCSSCHCRREIICCMHWNVAGNQCYENNFSSILHTLRTELSIIKVYFAMATKAVALCKDCILWRRCVTHKNRRIFFVYYVCFLRFCGTLKISMTNWWPLLLFDDWWRKSLLEGLERFLWTLRPSSF